MRPISGAASISLTALCGTGPCIGVCCAAACSDRWLHAAALRACMHACMSRGAHVPNFVAAMRPTLLPCPPAAAFHCTPLFCSPGGGMQRARGRHATCRTLLDQRCCVGQQHGSGGFSCGCAAAQAGRQARGHLSHWPAHAGMRLACASGHGCVGCPGVASTVPNLSRQRTARSARSGKSSTAQQPSR